MHLHEWDGCNPWACLIILVVVGATMKIPSIMTLRCCLQDAKTANFFEREKQQTVMVELLAHWLALTAPLSKFRLKVAGVII